jgi:hypothetical protein
MTHRYFTLAEANRTLPLVRRIVADITGSYPVWRDLVYRYEFVAVQARPETGETAEQLDLKRQIDVVAKEINDFLNELEEIGCVLKGFPDGLVDFYGKLDGRDIFWCWKLGEEEIRHWHELEAGFTGRQEIPVVATSNAE